MERISLNGSWRLKGRKENKENAELITLAGSVPGCVQLDLSREGYLPSDLFFGENILADEVLFSGEFTAPANATTCLTRLPVYYSDRGMLIFEWQTEEGAGFNHYLCAHPPVDFEFYKEMIKKYSL